MKKVSNWNKKLLGDFIKVQGGFAFKSEDFNDEGIPIIRMSDLKSGKISLENAAWVSHQYLKKLPNFLLRSGDFLVGMSGSIGNFAIVRKEDEPAFLNQRVGRFVLINDEESDYEFIKQVARSASYKFHVELMAAGAAQVNISPAQIESFGFHAPPKPEQSKIAEVLSKVDQAIEQTESLIAKQQRIKTGLMQDLLTRGIDEHGNLRSEETHEFKDSPLGRIPVEWEVDKLENVSDFITSGSRGWARYYSEEGAIFIRIGNLTREHIHMRFDDVVYVNPPLNSEGKRTEVNTGDLLISITADLGIIAVIPNEFPEAYVNQHIALVRLNNSKIVPCFAGWFLAGYRGQSQFDKLNESGAKAGLNLPIVQNLLVPRLDISEQEQIVNTLEANIYALRGHQSQLSKLRSLKTALMQDLLTGKVRVTPLLEKTEAHS